MGLDSGPAPALALRAKPLYGVLSLRASIRGMENRMTNETAQSANATLHNYAASVFENIATAWRESHLLRAEETPLDAPVYVELETRSISSWSADDDEQDLEEYIAALREVGEQAPDGCRVTIEYEREGDYDGPDIFNRRIGYYRPPTDAERAERAKENKEIAEVHARAAKRQEEKERAEFERLAAKFGSGGEEE